MKPQLANLFVINTTGRNNDFLLSFFYEWQSTVDGQTIEMKKELVSSVLLDISDFTQLAETIGSIKAQMDEINLTQGGETN